MKKTIRLKGIIYEDFVNYKKPCLTLEMPFCSFKCDKECGEQWCQNHSLINTDIHEIDITVLVCFYLTNKITEAVCFQGLEPFDSYDEMLEFIKELTAHECNDDIVIYTGYNRNEIDESRLEELKTAAAGDVIIKWGRFIPHREPIFDTILGVTLASDNQYGEKL